MNQKWDRIYRDSPLKIPQAAEVVRTNSHLLPSHGRALDLACGLGGNALLLARHGLDTVAWDNSAVAIERLQQSAAAHNVLIDAQQRDAEELINHRASYDVIVVSHFLERTLTDAIIKALTPGGLLFYQTWLLDKEPSIGPSNPLYLLATNELLNLFRPLTVLVYREEGRLEHGAGRFPNKAMLVARAG